MLRDRHLRSLSMVHYVVLDEADCMLELGYLASLGAGVYKGF